MNKRIVKKKNKKIIQKMIKELKQDNINQVMFGKTKELYQSLKYIGTIVPIMSIDGYSLIKFFIKYNN